MAKVRPRKVADFIKRELSQIIQNEIRDPQMGFITLTHVRMTDDLSLAYVYFTVFGDDEQAKRSLKVLQKSAGFLRTEIGRALRMRKIPALKFFHDESLNYANKIETIIHKIHKEEKPKSEEERGDE